MGKGDKKHKRRRQQARQQLRAQPPGKRKDAPQRATQPRTGQAVRPTPERMARGKWTQPQGMGKDNIAVTDMAADMVARLFLDGSITKGQEQAARTWQEIRARYEAELPDIAGYKSCIDGSVPGFDDGDGDPQVIEEYRAMERRLSLPQRRAILCVCWQDAPPPSMDVLRGALDVISNA